SESYFQRFDLDVFRPSPQTSLNVSSPAGSVNYIFGRDFLTTTTRETTITAPPVFIGFPDAYLAPEEEADLTNRIVVAFEGAKDGALDSAEARPRTSYRRFANAAAIILLTNEPINNHLESLANTIEKGTMSLAGSPRRQRGAPFVIAGQKAAAHILSQLPMSVAELRALASRDSTYGPVPLDKASLVLDFKAIHEHKSSENVAGLLEGSDPKLKDQFIVLTAHYDHVGVHPATGDIYNGADDDASGTSVILELAEAFVTNTARPKRSVVFMTVAGEEKGLLGSAYYTQHPVFPLDKTIANINIDMVGRTDQKHAKAGSPPYVYVIGSDKISTELDSILNVSNRQTVRLALDYEYNNENDPNQFYRRSDHYNFARKGIPVVFFFTGVHEDYHRPTDTVEKIEFDRMATIGLLVYATAWNASNFSRMLRKNGTHSAFTTGR
ncbi:MAG TPA: M28 family peptidase, partial [Bacteroidota bacterium]